MFTHLVQFLLTTAALSLVYYAISTALLERRQVNRYMSAYNDAYATIQTRIVNGQYDGKSSCAIQNDFEYHIAQNLNK